MTTRGLQLAFLMFLLDMAFSAGCVLSQRDVQQPRRIGSDALNINAPDLETIIAGMKYHDGLVISATGDFVIERYKHGGAEFEKIEYALTFEGEKVQVQVDWGWGPSFEEKIFLSTKGLHRWWDVLFQSPKFIMQNGIGRYMPKKSHS